MVSGPSGGVKAEGEQTLLDTMITRYPGVFTSDRIWVLDRNFPGADRVARMLATGTHVLIRVKSDLALSRIGGFLPDGSDCSYLTGGGGRWCLKVRVIEYHVTVDGQDVPEMFCLITDLHDHAVYPAAQLATAYAWRWTGSEIALKEAKSAIAGAGPSAGPILRSKTPELIDQEHPPGSAAPSSSAPGPRGRPPGRPRPQGRPPGQPVQPRHISFAAARRAGLDTPGPGPPPPACPPPPPPPCTTALCTTSANAASSPAGTGTATARPRPARHSPPPAATSPPAPRPPRSASARQLRPDRRPP